MEDNANNMPPELERHLSLCKRQCERMVREGTWPWPDWNDDPDSTLGGDLVESDDNPENV